ncbi:MAG: 2-dehydropantoate 2-reductase N-terminal domain-containing protein [Agathobacter sp.]
MDRHIIILTTDKRQAALGKLLTGRKMQCSWEEYKREEICEKIYVLPTPVSKLDKFPQMKEAIQKELVNCKGPLFVFAGAVTGEWKTFLESNGIAYLDFMQLQEVLEGNSVITAEATVAEILLACEKSICQQKILVTGYGCCGKPIASLLSAMGAEVTVAARRAEVRKEIREDGFDAVRFDGEKWMRKEELCISDIAAEVDTVVNTVPALVITDDIIEKMSKESLIVDIASSPGGTDFAAAEKCGITAKLAIGLPGIYTTTSSAELLKNAISKYAPLQKDVKEDRQWIFQIII